jgi:hypothetical protein
MSASCELTLTFHGTDDDFEKIINKIYEIEGKSRTENLILPLIQINGHKITAYNGMCHNIWGNNYLYPDVDMYMEFAKLVPDAAFDIDSYRVNEVGGGGAETYLKVSYKNRILNFDILSGVDDMSFPFIVAEMYAEYCGHEVHVATAGKSKLFDSILDLEEYIEDWDGIVSPNVTKKTEYLICNNPEMNTVKVRKAKELGIPIISEMKFIRMFTDVFDFEDDFETLFSDITYEEFCERLSVDETITPEVLEEMKEFPDVNGMIITPDGEVSLIGNWHKTSYYLGGDNVFRKKTEN